MKKILLVSNHVFHYRIKNYNFFFEEFQKCGFEFSVSSSSIDDVEFEILFPFFRFKKSAFDAIRVIREVKPDVVIVFLSLSDFMNFPVSLYCKKMGLPHIFWNKGLDVKNPKNQIKKILYNFLHDISNAIILYTPNEMKYIEERNREKVFIGFNSLNFQGLDMSKVNGISYVKNKYGIVQDKLLLFSATIKDDKMLDSLLDSPCPLSDIGVVIAGKGISSKQLDKIDKLSNYYYIGPVPYNDYEMNSIFKASKYFSTPGDLGLALNQAFFLGYSGCCFRCRTFSGGFLFKK